MSARFSSATRLLGALTIAGVVTAAAAADQEADPARSRVHQIKERFETTPDAADNVDSVAVAADEGWIVASTKGTHQLLVADAATGKLVRRVGAHGEAPGEFRRPNGIAIGGDLVFVVERDNARVQVLRLPDFEPLGFVGGDVLERPYGIALYSSAADVWELYVTDNFELPEAELAGNPRLAWRVKHFRVRVAGAELEAELVRSFGDLEGDGVLWKVESIAVDPGLRRLLVADEHEQHNALRVYDLEGRFSGANVGRGVVTSEPEGVVLWTCGSDGYWLSTDQHEHGTIFHVFERNTLEHLGAFTGAHTANTDGIALTQAEIRGFHGGAFYAVHDDQSLTAFDWRRIAKALGLERSCRR
jgi:3-phytase